MDKLRKQREYYQKQLEDFETTLVFSELSEEYSMIAMATMVHRGRMKDVNHFIKMLQIIQDRDSDLIRKDLLGDKKASEKDENGNFIYTGIGKTAGLKTYAVLSMDADDEQIEWFFTALKKLKKPMVEIQNKMLKRWDIDFKRKI